MIGDRAYVRIGLNPKGLSAQVTNFEERYARAATDVEHRLPWLDEIMSLIVCADPVARPRRVWGQHQVGLVLDRSQIRIGAWIVLTIERRQILLGEQWRRHHLPAT